MLESTTVPLHQILTQKIIYIRNFAPNFDFFSIQWSFVGDTMTLEMVIRKELVSFKESNRFAI